MPNIEFTKKDLEVVAKLSRLHLSEVEKDKFLEQLRSVLEYVGVISAMTKPKLEASGEETYARQFSESYNKNSLREDRVLTEGNFYTAAILANAKETQDNFIEVGQVLAKHKVRSREDIEINKANKEYE